MCGRFVIFSSIRKIALEFSVDPGDMAFSPAYNIAPSQEILIVLFEGDRKLIKCRWGFIPPWAKDMHIGYKMINARAETLSEKPIFKSAIRRHRCLVVADGFYEWEKVGKEKKPYYIHLKSGRPFGFAGLYSYWQTPDDSLICTGTIITTNANSLLEPIHNRMPVIIPEDSRSEWLNPDIQDERRILPLLTPYDSENMEAYRVSTVVNSPGNDSPDNIKSYQELEAG
ncbi:MAG: SOS response-associated peptidase [Nitrospirae bacterium]|nr:SOS response-associated peptidase [Nitrospirota bacterium]